MPNDLFLASNEPAQKAIEQIGLTRSRNALTQGAQLQNQTMQMDLQRRQELEQLLRTSQNPERDGYEWAKRNDQKLYTDLSKFYMDRFIQKLDVDENQARSELESATGEKIQMGQRFVALFKNEAGQADPSLGVWDKIGHTFHKPHDAAELARLRSDLTMGLESVRQEGRLALEQEKAKTDKSIQPYEDLRSDDPKRRAAALEYFKLIAQQKQESPFQNPQSQLAGMDTETGKLMSYVPDRTGEGGKLVPVAGQTGGLGPKISQPLPDKAQGGLTGGLNSLSYLEQLEQLVPQTNSDVPVWNVLRGMSKQAGVKAGFSGPAQQFEDVLKQMRIEAQSIIKGIPSNFDVQTFISSLPGLDQSATQAKNNIRLARTKLSNEIRNQIAYFKGTNRVLPQEILGQAQRFGIDVGSVPSSPDPWGGGGAGAGVPPPGGGAPAAPSGGVEDKVVVEKGGKKFKLPRRQLAQAQAEGYTLAQ